MLKQKLFKRPGEQGSAMIEFLGLGLLLMVPTMYFLLAVFSLQSGAMAANAASQQAIQLVQNTHSESLNESAVQGAAAFAAADYGVEAERVSARLVCEGSCATSSSVRVDVTVSVGLPLIPWVSGAQIAELSSSATAWGGKYQ